MGKLLKVNIGALALAVFMVSQVVAVKLVAAGGTFVSAAYMIEKKLAEARTLYDAGNMAGAKGKVSDAYFEVFEGSGLETAVKLRISEKRALELEAMFGDLRQALGRKDGASGISARVSLLVKALHEDAAMLDKAAAAESAASPAKLFFDSFLIIVREGFEAILVITALLVYLLKSGHGGKRRKVLAGAALALPASAATALILNTVLSSSGPAREGLEGITMLTATIVLFYVSYWLISKAEAGRWQRFIKDKVDASLDGRGVFALGFAAFLAVYREGAETILFYQALVAGSPEGSATTVAYGFVAGSLSLLLLYILMKYLSLKVPVAPFFAITGMLLYYLAFSFAGRGIAELQEAGWASSTPLTFTAIHFFGIYPTMEGLAVQGALLAAAVGAGMYAMRGRIAGKRLSSNAGSREAGI